MRTTSLPNSRNHAANAVASRPFLLTSPSLHKQPQWNKEAPLYLFVGGAAGAASAIACTADSFSDDIALVNHARWVAAAGGALSGLFKPQSSVSMGAWTLTIFSTFAGAAAFANQMRQELDGLPVRVVEIVAGSIAGLTGVVMSTYTGVLLGGATIPVWNRNIGAHAQLAASGMNSAVSILELLGHNSRALNLLGLACSAVESVEGMRVETGRNAVNKPLTKGAGGLIVRLGGVLSGTLPLLLRITYLFTRRRDLRRAAAYSSLAGSLLTRFGWLQAGKSSTSD